MFHVFTLLGLKGIYDWKCAYLFRGLKPMEASLWSLLGGTWGGNETSHKIQKARRCFTVVGTCSVFQFLLVLFFVG